LEKINQQLIVMDHLSHFVAVGSKMSVWAFQLGVFNKFWYPKIFWYRDVWYQTYFRCLHGVKPIISLDCFQSFFQGGYLIEVYETSGAIIGRPIRY
jgi:hypothetical protein